MSFVYGLIPPPTVEAAARCPSGVAKVETQLSFLNQLVSFLTLGLVTPMQIDVTCARTSGTDDATSLTMSAGPDVGAAVRQAADLAVSKKQPVFVRF